MNWKPGDQARVNLTRSCAHGDIVTVLSELMFINCSMEGSYMGHEVDFANPDDPREWLAFEPHELLPISDGSEKCSWDDCVWRPTEVV